MTLLPVNPSPYRTRMISRVRTILKICGLHLNTFPSCYKGYDDYSEAYNFADQSGVYEIASSNHFSAGQKSMKQVNTNCTLYWVYFT